ncbi:D-alanyl-D-alanine carboxypeptidase [Streptomyces sp. 796.1]|uniref:D-alanyl-D-alanine carboxypeptidase n=1 Tax=Streptomyces sp. 796.1 TaxID=3163029 RepID=UPI0039C9697B
MRRTATGRGGVDADEDAGTGRVGGDTRDGAGKGGAAESGKAETGKTEETGKTGEAAETGEAGRDGQGREAGLTSGADSGQGDRATAVLRTGPLPSRPGARGADDGAGPTGSGAGRGAGDDDGAADAGDDAGAAASDAVDSGSAAAESGAGAAASGSASGSGSAVDSDSDADGSGDRSDGAETGADGGPARDARLRAAVAAWVAKGGQADPEPSAARTGEGAPKGADKGADDTSDGATEGTRAGRSAAERAAARAASVASGANAARAARAAAERADAAAAGDDAPGGTSDGAPGGTADDAAAGAKGAKGAAAPSKSAAASGAGTGTTSGAGTASGTSTDSDADGDSASGSASAAGTGSAADSADSAGDSGEGSSAGPAGTSADRATAVFGTLRATDKRAGAGASGGRDRSEPQAGADTDADAGTDDTDGTGAGDDAKARATVDSPTSVLGVLSPRDLPARGAGAKGKGPAARTTAAAAADQDTDTDADAAAGSKASPAAGGVTADRPTTAFKALRPSDTPRTGGDAATDDRASDEDESSGSGKGKSKGAATGAPARSGSGERTSQFVPLRSADDERSARSAAAGARAEGAAPAESGAVPETERTKQQPVLPASAAAGAKPGMEPTVKEGPSAPLDLLAQLTNTPPPPQTLTRTVLRRVKIWTPLVLILAIVFCVAQSFRPLPTPELKLTASDSFTFDGAKPSMPWPAKGQAVIDVEGLGSLGTFGEQKPAPIASVAKVMTAYVIMRDHPMKSGSDGPKIKIDAKAAADAGKDADGESVVKVEEGAEITQREAIEGIMIASANNIARLLARWDAGSEQAFVQKMNEAAKSLGMANTTYTDPSGLNATTVSTATDQVKLAKKAMDDPVFREVVRMPKYTDSRGDEHGNWNRLVPFNGVVGIKTGTTTKAGGNLVFAAEKEIGGTTQLIIGAVLSQPPAASDNSILTAALDASKALILDAQKTLQARKVVKKGDVVGEVDDGLGGTTKVVAAKDVTAVGWPGLTVDLKLTDNGEKLPHTADAGTEVGTLTVGSGPGQVKVPVTLQSDLAEPSFGSKLVRIT